MAYRVAYKVAERVADRVADIVKRVLWGSGLYSREDSQELFFSFAQMCCGLPKLPQVPWLHVLPASCRVVPIPLPELIFIFLFYFLFFTFCRPLIAWCRFCSPTCWFICLFIWLFVCLSTHWLHVLPASCRVAPMPLPELIFVLFFFILFFTFCLLLVAWRRCRSPTYHVQGCFFDFFAIIMFCGWDEH